MLWTPKGGLSRIPSRLFVTGIENPRSNGIVQDLAFGIAGSHPGQDLLAVFVVEVAGHDRDKVHEIADEEAAEGEQPDKSGPDLADIEPVAPEHPEICAQQKRDEPGFL
jgi:hypothetical protein